MDNSHHLDLAKNILKVARNTLIVNLRFMDSAMSRLLWKPFTGTVATNGKYLLFDPAHMLKSYKQGKNIPAHIYLHVVFHCVFQHFYVDVGRVNQELWDIACDIAVEAVILDLGIDQVSLKADQDRLRKIMELKSKCKYLTAESIYRYLLEADLNENELFHLGGAFRFDDHFVWYLVGEATDKDGDENTDKRYRSSSGNVPNSGSGKGNGKGGAGGTGGAGGDKNDKGGNGGGNSKDNQSGGSSSDSNGMSQHERDQLKKDWQNVSQSMQTDMETFSKNRGNSAGNLMQNLTSVNREKYDYSSFLKKFAVMGETMKVNDDEFDYIFYSYGMQLFDRPMPLIEPLEYKDDKRIKEFVIAIDTSGSVQGDLVQKFLNKTYNILKQEESFFTKINLHIVQCDTEITEDKKITNQEEFDEYIANMTLKGFGGTDFRPVFEHVDEMIKNKEFTNLKGLIYFTDGFGEFPAKQPSYNTAFVYIDDGYNNYDVPVWAIKLILQSEDI